MDKQKAIDTANQYFQLLLSDFPASAEMLSDDFVWENFLPANVPFGGRYEGVSELQQYLEQIAATWVIGELIFDHYIYDPETRTLAGVGVEKGGKALATGRSCDMSFVWEFRFNADGKLEVLLRLPRLLPLKPRKPYVPIVEERNKLTQCLFDEGLKRDVQGGNRRRFGAQITFVFA